MSGKKRELSPEEKVLWRRVARTVKTRAPLPDEDEPELRSPDEAKPRAGAHVSKSTPLSDGPRVSLRSSAERRPAPVADRGAEKRVRRGNIEIGGTLDLHGHTQDTAFAAVVRFLLAAQSRGHRAVIVVTGQGRDGEGVLKKRFRDWIEARDLKPIISGYAQAHRGHGGAGAFYVFLKRRGD